MDEDSSFVSLSLKKYNELYDKSKIGANKWRPISEYNRELYDWVLVKCFEGSFECIPFVAEMRNDGKWYDRPGEEVTFEVRYFFDMQQLDQ